jgi:TolB-like protein
MKAFLYVLFPALLLAGCSDFGQQRSAATAQPTWEEAATNEFIPTNYKAANALIDGARARGLEQDRPLLIATLVNINALDESSGFGRMVAEQISAKFSHQGFSMVEMKFRDNVYVKQNVGELLLTREIKDIAHQHKAQAVIVGTYAESDRFVFVNLKVIRPTDNIVISSHDYAVPVNKMVRSLLGRH